MSLTFKSVSILLQCAFMVGALPAFVYADVKVDRIHFAADGSLMSSANQLVKNQGVWSGTPTYSVNDVVLYQGVLYICTFPNTNTPPSSNPSSWSTFAAQGAQGVPGPQGPAGPQGQAGSGFRWRGPFDSAGAEYEINDVTESDGSSYIVVDKITNLCDTPKFCTEPVTVMWAKPGSPDEKGWQLVVAQGLRGATGAAGVQGPAGPAGQTGPQGPSGPGLASLDALRGLLCNVGTLYQGTVNVTYSVSYVSEGVPVPNKNNISMECAYTGHDLSISVIADTVSACGTYVCGSHYETCGTWPNEFQCLQPTYCTRFCGLPTVVSSQPTGISINYTFDSSLTTPDSRNYNISAGTVLTLTETNGGVFGGDCTGTGSCTMTMSGPKTVTVTR